MENILISDASDDEKQVAFMRFYMTLIHETGHELNKYGKPFKIDEQGIVHYTKLNDAGYSHQEQGDKAEDAIWGTDDYKPYTAKVREFENGEQDISSYKYANGVTEEIIKEMNKTEEGRKSLPTVPTQ